MRHMHADLVSAPGFQFATQMGMRSKALFNPIVCHGRFTVLCHCHAFAINMMPTNWRINRAPGGKHPAGNSLIFTNYGALLQLADQ